MRAITFIPISQMRKQRGLVTSMNSHSKEGISWDLNPESLTLESFSLTVRLFYI